MAACTIAMNVQNNSESQLQFVNGFFNDQEPSLSEDTVVKVHIPQKKRSVNTRQNTKPSGCDKENHFKGKHNTGHIKDKGPGSANIVMGNSFSMVSFQPRSFLSSQSSSSCSTESSELSGFSSGLADNTHGTATCLATNSSNTSNANTSKPIITTAPTTDKTASSRTLTYTDDTTDTAVETTALGTNDASTHWSSQAIDLQLWKSGGVLQPPTPLLNPPSAGPPPTTGGTKTVPWQEGSAGGTAALGAVVDAAEPGGAIDILRHAAAGWNECEIRGAEGKSLGLLGIGTSITGSSCVAHLRRATIDRGKRVSSYNKGTCNERSWSSGNSSRRRSSSKRLFDPEEGEEITWSSWSNSPTSTPGGVTSLPSSLGGAGRIGGEAESPGTGSLKTGTEGSKILIKHRAGHHLYTDQTKTGVKKATGGFLEGLNSNFRNSQLLRPVLPRRSFGAWRRKFLQIASRRGGPGGERSSVLDTTHYQPCAMGDDGEAGEQQELVGNNPTQRNWRGILIALLVICIVCSLIITAVILVTPKDEDEESGEKFTFDDMFSPDYKPRHFTAEWVGDSNTYVYRSREGELMEYDADKNRTSVIMDNSTFRQLNTDTYYVSPDLQYVLIAYDIQRVYRHSFLAKYKIYQRYAQDPKDRLLPFPQGRGRQWDGLPLQYAGWASKGQALTFVFDNNLYYQSDPMTTASRVTDSGRNRLVFNGIPDWVYEEEILHSNKAHWWSPDSAYICYAKFDDSGVPIYRFPTYGPGTNIYGFIDEIAYPKAGDKGDVVNPKVQLFIIETKNLGVSRPLSPPGELEGKEYYVTMVTWRDNTHLLIAWSNRAQNKSILTLCDALTAECHTNLIETNNEGKGWVTVPTPIFMNGGQRFLMVLSERDGNFGFWKHIAMITTPLGTEGTKIFITQGTWDVTELLAYDEEEKYVYFQSTNRDPRKRHIFRTTFDNDITKVATIESADLSLKTPECLTCEYPEECQYISANFAKSAKYYILHCEGPGVPQYILKSTIDPRHIVLEDNAELASRLSTKALPKKEYMEIDTGDGQKIWAEVYLPPILKKDHITKYPLLIHTYGGPGTQKVTEQFSLGWSTYLTSSENVIYASIDGRGSGARGDRFLHTIYRNLGTLEVQDQLTGAKFMKETMQYVDERRTSIWGWSYGGFVTAHALGDDSIEPVFSCGVAVAPVTDWRYYDTVYTERYMGLAHSNDNYKGYDNANVSTKAANFRGKDFLIVHGTADDNVHFQHTAQFIKALTEADVDFRIQVYSDKNHAIGGKVTSRHLHRTMTDFLKHQCWKGGAPRVNDKFVTEIE